MENCYYDGKTICTFDLKDENGLYYEELVLAWKEAAAGRRLSCVECGAPVYLAAGPIKEPYFAHYDLEECDYGKGIESEELKIGKRLLYHLLKRSFPNYDIWARYRMDNGMFCTLYCECEAGPRFALDYRLQNNSLEKFRLRDNYFQSKQIIPIYILGKRLEKNTKQLDWYQNLLQSSMGYLAFLDVKKECLTLKKSFGYRIGNERKFRSFIKTYSIKELTLLDSGQMQSDFTIECSRIEQEIEEEKNQHQWLLQKRKDLQKEIILRENKERERMEEYRRQQERERIEEYSRHQERERMDEYRRHQEHGPMNEYQRSLEHLGLNPDILDKCKKMIEEGNGHLVSKKYYDAIVSNKF